MKAKNHFAFIILFLLGTTLLVNQVSQPVLKMSAKADTHQSDEENSDNKADKDFVFSENLAINTINSVTVHQEFYQIREIILDDVAEPHPVHNDQLLIECEHFKTLFSKVISPNAP